MHPHEPPSVTVSRCGSTDPASDPFRAVVWVRGDHDIATRAHLSRTIVEAARVDDADVVVDLDGVTFMDASTVGAIVDAHNHLRARSRSLAVRAPSALVRRLFDVCDLAFLIDDERPPVSQPRAGSALRSWVAVPASDRTSESRQPPVPDPEPVRPTAPQGGEPAGSVRQRRASS